jgi:hypothetical protein
MQYSNEITVKDIISGSWGLVAHRRKEIEDEAFGTFDRIVNEELLEITYSIEELAKELRKSISAARKFADRHDIRYICIGAHKKKFFVKRDVVEKLGKIL